MRLLPRYDKRPEADARPSCLPWLDERGQGRHSAAVVHSMTRSARLTRHCPGRAQRSADIGYLVHSVRAAKPPGRSPAPHERKLSTQHTWASWCTPSSPEEPPAAPDDRPTATHDRGADRRLGVADSCAGHATCTMQISPNLFRCHGGPAAGRRPAMAAAMNRHMRPNPGRGPGSWVPGMTAVTCAGDQPPVPSPARTVGFRVCGFREPTTGHTAPGVITLTPDIEWM